LSRIEFRRIAQCLNIFIGKLIRNWFSKNVCVLALKNMIYLLRWDGEGAKEGILTICVNKSTSSEVTKNLETFLY